MIELSDVMLSIASRMRAEADDLQDVDKNGYAPTALRGYAKEITDAVHPLNRLEVGPEEMVRADLLDKSMVPSPIEEVKKLQNEIDLREKRMAEIRRACTHVWEVKVKQQTGYRVFYSIECSACGRYLGQLEDYVEE